MDVRNPIVTNVVVLNKAEGSSRGFVLDERSCDVDVVGPLDKGRSINTGLCDRSIDVLAQRRETEGVEINGTACQTRSCIGRWVTTNIARG